LKRRIANDRSYWSAKDADLLLQRRVKLLADLEFTGFSKRGANKLLAVVKVTMPDNATDQ
jgi:hypothetical protein